MSWSRKEEQYLRHLWGRRETTISSARKRTFFGLTERVRTEAFWHGRTRICLITFALPIQRITEPKNKALKSKVGMGQRLILRHDYKLHLTSSSISWKNLVRKSPNFLQLRRGLTIPKISYHCSEHSRLHRRIFPSIHPIQAKLNCSQKTKRRQFVLPALFGKPAEIWGCFEVARWTRR